MTNQHPDQGAPVPPDFRALCVKLAEDVRYLSECLRDPEDGYDPVCLSECESDYHEARAALAQPAACDYPNCVDDSPDERCSRWLTGECQGPDSRAALAQPVPPRPTDEELWHTGDEDFRKNTWPMDAVRFARAVLARWGNTTPQPVPVSERLPDANVKVLAHYFNSLGQGRTVCAIWVPAKTRSDDIDSSDDDFQEYDEETDRFYWPEGWYEAIENWEDLGWVRIYEGEVAYWQPLPKWPAHALPIPGDNQ